MRSVPPAFQSQLDSGATTHCRCWRIDRNFGEPLGFTDHDENVLFDGIVFESAAGFDASEIETSLGLAVDNGAASGALQSDKIAESDIRNGDYDGAEIRQWVVDWRNPSNRLLTFRGEIGEIKRGEQAFEVELRGISERLNRAVGRSFMHICDAEMGDVRCKFDLAAPGFRGTGGVLSVEDARTLRASGLSAFSEGWFDDGVLRWTTGALAGRRARVAVHRQGADGAFIALAAEMASPPTAGDAFEIDAGCDKRVETCRTKFANAKNFRGFPFMPGDSWVAAYPVEGGEYDGGSLE